MSPAICDMRIFETFFEITLLVDKYMGFLQDRLSKYTLPQQYMAQGVYPYFREIDGKQGTEVDMGGHKVLMFGSNAYTGLTGDDRITCMYSWRRNWPNSSGKTRRFAFRRVSR